MEARRIGHHGCPEDTLVRLVSNIALGLLVPLSLGALPACVRTAPLDDTGGSVVVAPPVLQALQGDGFAAIWTDRELVFGERVLRVEPDGSSTELGDHGQLWLDLEPGPSYRWVGADDSLEVTPGRLDLSLDDQRSTVAQRGDFVTRTLAWAGADLYALPVVVVVERDDGEAWLEASCEDGLPCWRDEPCWWASFEPGDLPDAVSPGWYAEAAEPSLVALELRLELLRDGVGWPLATVDDALVETGRRLLWGDLHSHTNLSGDACEDLSDSCLPWGTGPGSEVFAAAEQAGLDFLALTDHAEHQGYLRLDQGSELDIHGETLRLAAQAEGGPVIPIVGFEWTGVYDLTDSSSGASAIGGGHRTVIFDGLEPCAAFWVGAGEYDSPKALLGFEDYSGRSTLLEQPDQLQAHLAQVALECDPVRVLSWFHHPGSMVPRPVDWAHQTNRSFGDTIVEIYSEHGSSECYDLGSSGCDWSVLEQFHAPASTVQAALQLGYAMGFVAGTDSHDARPGSVEDGPSVVIMADVDGEIVYQEQTTPGGVTGVLAAGAVPGREQLLDALEQRRTLAASWLFDVVRIAAVGQDGEVYLPGDDVPAAASPLELVVELEDEAVESWKIEVVDPLNELWLEQDHSRLQETLDLNPGDVRYLRVQATMQGQEHRLWASPFFGVE